PADQKRKRGRPSNASKGAQKANGEAGAEEGSSPNDKAKKKRGRPPKVAEAPTEDATESELATKKKRGRPSLNKESVAKEPIEVAKDEPAPKKRGRKPKERSGDAEEPVPEEVAEVEPAPKRKRGRPSLGEEHVTKDVAETADKGLAPKKRERKLKAVMEAEGPPAEEEPAAGKKKRGRPAIHPGLEVQEASQSELKGVRRRKGRPPSPTEEAAAVKPTKKRRKRSSQGEEEVPEPSPETQRRRPGRSRTSDAASSTHAPEDQASKPRKSKKRPAGDNDATDPVPAKKRRRRTSEEIRQQQQQQQQQQQPRAEPGTVRPTLKYRHIAPRARQIPRSTIEENWSPLAPQSLAHVSSLLRLSERPVLQRLAANEKRRDQAASAIRLVTRRLTKKLSRGLPFPPATAPPTGSRSSKKHDADGGRTEELNFERVIENVAALEKQLDPLLHAIKLLKAEKERDERALEADYESLTTLEANARSEARNFKDNLRKTHVLVPEKRGTAGTAGRDAGGNEHDFKFDLEDDELRGLAGQVGSHMESMRNNLQQIDGVLPQIVRTRAALQNVLFKQLDQQNYENVLFG
ncbi:CENP-Q, a CENPA-CAD centromere complex subunit-domain-containing protein, partial [Colletotrichum navitas]